MNRKLSILGIYVVLFGVVLCGLVILIVHLFGCIKDSGNMSSVFKYKLLGKRLTNNFSEMIFCI